MVNINLLIGFLKVISICMFAEGLKMVGDTGLEPVTPAL